MLFCYAALLKDFDFFFSFQRTNIQKAVHLRKKKYVSLQCCTFSNEGPSRISSRIASTSASRNFKCLPKNKKKTKQNIIKPNSLVRKYTKKVGCLYFFLFQKKTKQKKTSFDIIIQSYLICQNIKIQLQSEPTGAFCEGFDFR